MGSLKKELLNMIPGPMVIFFARPYVAGASMQSAIDLADKIYTQRNGLLSTIDVLGEDVKREEDARAACNLYLKTLDALGERKYSSVSIKPGHMGYYVSKSLCRENIEAIVKKGFEKKIPVTIDMEDTDQTDHTLDLYHEMVKKYPGTGTVLQSKLWRTYDDIDRFDDVKMTVRLCIGIYDVPKYAYKGKPAAKENLLVCMKKLFEKGHIVQVATHDETLLRRAVEYIEEWKIPKEQFEFQMLLGVPRAQVRSEIRDKGYNFRLYLPFCEKWDDGIAYLRRRLNANPHFVFYVMQNMMRGSI